MKSSCCKSYKKMGKACKKCPVMGGRAGKKARKQLKRAAARKKAA